MTKKDIVRLVSEKTELSQQTIKEVVQSTLESIVEILVRDGRIELRNFGVFQVKARAERLARNPRTGEEVIVPEHETVAFKPGKLMTAHIQAERQKKLAKKRRVAKTAKAQPVAKTATKSTAAKATIVAKTNTVAKTTKKVCKTTKTGKSSKK